MADSKKLYQTAEPMVYHCAWDTRQTVLPGSCYGPVLRDVYTMECNVSGYGTITINDRTFCISPGDFYFLLPGQTVTFTADHKDPRIALWCTAGGLRLGQVLTAVGINAQNPFAPAEKFDRMLEIMQRMYALGSENDTGTQLRRTACIYELLGVLAEGHARSTADLFAQQAIGIMETDYHKPLSVADVAAQMGFDRCYFSTLFKESVGVSPHAYLTSLRIRKACALLSDTNATVSQVAESVGLDPRNFARLFKKETGETPNAYKKPANGVSFN